MLNNLLTQQLKGEFTRQSGDKLTADNNPADFAVFLYEKQLKAIAETVTEELTKTPAAKPYLDSFQKNLQHKLGSSF
ncbi:hypothetical protein ACFGVS_03100 [Mucilaginibacter sp. AW1-7]|uniref:hypothetical protein n=1 Tax=Mucilaginibacter sp. AW1-7 TaxID=3349874 RepID=UPI003F735AAC